MKHNNHEHEHHGHNHSEHGENCDCGCHSGHGDHPHHEHDHHEHHHHEHDHGHDGDYEKFIENTMVLSRSWNYSVQNPVSLRILEEKAKALFLDLGTQFSVEGIILGHIKGVIKTGADSFYSLSMTREGQTDVTASKNWTPDHEAAEYTFTINILSMKHIPVEEEYLHKAMIA
ncbi:hypothetical protein [Parasporobacterium paucivorans]|uniref:Uncharacterized protein n=1 Tax=Parasporobacterium paucivorans DSM 15970 TaxID=1122934 RepID=A0A1M6IKF6_9FIRM|nr:hypothetical protein [Parasporobacterium paucivorans]SHJ34894.1 hypothetical protein SAMN02745691_01805 [Parasporobacterium paucivorans DSM 15970]